MFTENSDGDKRQPRQVRIPGFSAGDDVGLGDAITRVTSAVGIRSCTPCKRRAEALNQRVTFTGRSNRSD